MPGAPESTTKLAYIAMPADPMSVARYRIIKEELERNHGYQLLRREDLTGTDPASIFSVLAHAHLVIVDVSRLDQPIEIALGAAIAFATHAGHGAQNDGPHVIVIGDQQAAAPDAAAQLPFEHYERNGPKTAAQAISRLLARERAVISLHPLTDLDLTGSEPTAGPSISDLQAMVPIEVSEEIDDPVVAFLLTLYIEHIGSIVGEELAATTGFPPFPELREERLDLIHGVMRRRRSLDSGAVLDLLEQSLKVYLNAEFPGLQQVPDGRGSARAQLLASAVISKRRDDAQLDELSKTLSRIASKTTVPRTDIRSWPAGIKAISRITRLIVSAAAPPAVATMDRLMRSDSRLRAIATLGGALFLQGSIGILGEDDAGQARLTYGSEGLRIAELTRESHGQRVEPMTGDQLTAYKAGLRNLASRDDSVFAVEHPFHFRVLLEVLSDENRRYPAESVLNFEALRCLWGASEVWEHFVWSRDQHPIVGNLVENEAGQRDLAFLQTYVSFGRTPHTSSFLRLDYDPVAFLGEATENAEPHRTSWWPEAAAHLRSEPIRNLPSSVCSAMHAIRRQGLLGRIWRGDVSENDLLWIGSELITWNGFAFTDGALADTVWDSSRWADPGFPRMVLAEIRIGTWLLQALGRRLESLALVGYPAAGGPQPSPTGIPAMPEMKITEEIRCVLSIMCLFVADYLSGAGDGIAGLQQSLDSLKEDQQLLGEMGILVSQRLDQLRRLVDEEKGRLEDEMRSARQLLDALPRSAQ
jgi:hypothetical protein